MTTTENENLRVMFEDKDTTLREIAANLHDRPRPVDRLEPGSEAWTRAMTATKVPAVLGVDGFGNTRYTLWQQLAGRWTPPFTGNAATRRGTHLERGIADWWHDDHPDYHMEPAGTWQHPTLDWAYATPDFLLEARSGEIELLEVKTSASMDGFGDPERKIIPAHYWAQIVWQSAITGVRTVNLTVLGTFLERPDYRFEFDDFTVDSVVEEVTEFMDSLPGGVREWEPLPETPELDWEAALAVTEVSQESVDVSELYDGYAAAKRAAKVSGDEAEAFRKQIITASAAAEVALAGDVTVATRTDAGKFRFRPVKARDTPNVRDEVAT